MHFIWFIITGLIVGALGRLVHPGKDPMGWLMTLGIGVVAMLIAALISSGWLARSRLLRRPSAERLPGCLSSWTSARSAPGSSTWSRRPRTSSARP